MKSIRAYVLTFSFILLTSWALADALDFASVNLTAVASDITEMHKPLVLYVAHTTCPYCKRLEKEIMPAVLNTEDYQNKIILQKLVWNSARPVIWANREEIVPDDLVSRYKVRATPTLLFVDEQGNEIAKRIEGYRGADFYWVYLDRAIKEARTALMERP